MKKLFWAQPKFFGNEETYVRDALRSTWISGGPFVERLEREIGELTGARHVAAVANGTVALHCIYLALGLKAGEEVVVPGFGYMAAANIALLCGLKPVFTEVDERGWCVEARHIEAVLSPRTRAIVVIHTYGNMCDMESIMALGRERGIPVIEDTAEAFGSKYRGKWAGAIGDFGTYSFQATKTITTGEGGVILTDREEDYKKCCLYRSHGMDRGKRHYWHEVAGHNFRLANFQAAMGCAQLEHLDEILRRRRELKELYWKLLRECDGVTLQEFNPQVESMLWVAAVKLKKGAFPQGRDEVLRQMSEAEIECRPGFYAASQQPSQRCEQAIPICEDLAENVVSLPTHLDLTDEDVERVVKTLIGLKR